MAAGEKQLPVGSLADITSADDISRSGVRVDVPEWGVAVLVRGLSWGETREWHDTEGALESDAVMLSHGLVEPSLTVEQALEVVRTKSGTPLRRVLERVMELSGLTDGFREGNPDSDGNGGS